MTTSKMLRVVCENWAEFNSRVRRVGCLWLWKIEFDDPELDIEQLDELYIRRKRICKGGCLNVFEKAI